MKVIGFCGYSGAGKTTLIEGLIPRFVNRGLKVSLIKHAHHGFDIDKPGKDSWRHREAGASEVVLLTDRRWVLMHESREAPPQLDEMIARLSPCDLVVLEGFKTSAFDKIEVHRPANGKPLLGIEIPGLIAVASDGEVDSTLLQLDLNDHAAIATFVLNHTGLT
jgi:molybdopterin-guanine dinucleotide biosynthesis protein B